MNGPGLENWQHHAVATLILFVWCMLQTFTTSCLRKLVRVCLAVISLIAFSHRIFKHRTIVTKYFTWKYHTMLHFLCRCSYLFTFFLYSPFYWHWLKINSYFFWPTLYSSYKIYKSERKIKCHWTSLACRIGLISYMILCKLLLKLARSGCAKHSWRRAYVLRVFLINAFYCTERFLSEQLSQQLLDRSSPNLQGW